MTTQGPNDTSPRLRPADPAALPPEAWSTTVRIDFGRCDAAGIVYTPQYFDLVIAALEVWYEEALGFTLRDLIFGRRIGLGYAEATANFFVPSRFGDRLTFIPLLDHIGRSSFCVRVHAVADGRMRASARLVSVATSLETGEVLPLPTDVRDGLRRYQEVCAGGG